MRFVQHLLWNIKFQARYGFYLLYGLLTLLYTVLLINLPQFWKEGTAAILVFSDPAAMGLFFMGAIVLLEKSQRVTSLFAVSPLTAFEYVSSKVLSLSSISLFVAMVLAVASKCMSLPLVMLGTFLSSILFTMCCILLYARSNNGTKRVIENDIRERVFLYSAEFSPLTPPSLPLQYPPPTGNRQRRK